MISFDVTMAKDLGGESYLRIFAEREFREGIHKAIADEARAETTTYLRGISAVRHKTAARLGATPTGELQKAAERVTSRSSEEEAAVVLTGPMFARAFRDVEIRAKSSRYLTIPISAEAYGVRARELENRLGPLVAVSRKNSGKKGQGVLIEKETGKAHYVLATSVTQKQDRELLPPDEKYQHLASLAAENYLTKVFDL